MSWFINFIAATKADALAHIETLAEQEWNQVAISVIKPIVSALPDIAGQAIKVVSEGHIGDGISTVKTDIGHIILAPLTQTISAVADTAAPAG